MFELNNQPFCSVELTIAPFVKHPTIRYFVQPVAKRGAGSKYPVPFPSSKFGFDKVSVVKDGFLLNNYCILSEI